MSGGAAADGRILAPETAARRARFGCEPANAVAGELDASYADDEPAAGLTKAEVLRAYRNALMLPNPGSPAMVEALASIYPWLSTVTE